jgi:hypothetical protein
MWMAVGPGGGEVTKSDVISVQVDSGDGSGGCRCQRQVEEDGAGCGVRGTSAEEEASLLLFCFGGEIERTVEDESRKKKGIFVFGLLRSYRMGHRLVPWFLSVLHGSHLLSRTSMQNIDGTVQIGLVAAGACKNPFLRWTTIRSEFDGFTPWITS